MIRSHQAFCTNTALHWGAWWDLFGRNHTFLHVFVTIFSENNVSLRFWNSILPYILTNIILKILKSYSWWNKTIVDLLSSVSFYHFLEKSFLYSLYDMDFTEPKRMGKYVVSIAYLLHKVLHSWVRKSRLWFLYFH